VLDLIIDLLFDAFGFPLFAIARGLHNLIRKYAPWSLAVLGFIGLVLVLLTASYFNPLIYHFPAMMFSRLVGDRATEASHLNTIGLIYKEKGRYDQALDYYNQALLIRRETGDRWGVCCVLNNIGIAYNMKGDYEQALVSYDEALSLSREYGDQAREANVLIGMGSAYALLQRYDQAFAAYKQTLALYRALGDRYGEAEVLYNIGITYQDQGKQVQTRNYLSQALELVHKINAQDLEQRINHRLEAISIR
jgi:tetratricopeptide (TPR) repeat protein